MIEQLAPLQRLRGRLHGEPLAQAVGPELAAHRQVTQSAEQLGPEIDHVLAQLTGPLRAPVEIGHGLGAVGHGARP